MLDRDGFLSPDIAGWISKHRSTNHDWFSLAEELNAIAQSLIIDARVAADERAIFSALLFTRGLGSFQAALLLTERGLTADARTIIRSCFETVFYRSALVKDPTFAEQLKNDDQSKRKKIVRPLMNEPLRNNLSPEQRNNLSRMLDGLDSSLSGGQLNIENAARVGGLQGAYDVFYRSLSTDSAHPSLTALLRHVRTDENGVMIGLRWGPDVDDVADTLDLACISILHLVGVDEEAAADSRFRICWDRYKALSAENRPQ